MTLGVHKFIYWLTFGLVKRNCSVLSPAHKPSPQPPLAGQKEKKDARRHELNSLVQPEKKAMNVDESDCFQFQPHLLRLTWRVDNHMRDIIWKLQDINKKENSCDENPIEMGGFVTQVRRIYFTKGLLLF